MHSYESIKSSIRLLLQSSRHGLTLKQLNSDFQIYNQMENIPFERFGYSTLGNFLHSMKDILQIDQNRTPPIVFSRSNFNSNALKPIQIHSIPMKKDQQENFQQKILFENKSFFNDKKVKRVKRLVLRPLSTNTDRWTNRSRTSSNDHLVYHFKRLSLKQKNSSENLYSYNLFNIQINPKIQCRIVRYSDDKFYIPCHELADLLQIREEELDRETMFSRVRIYPSSDLYHKLEKEDHHCRHRKNHRKPFRFLFLVNSIVSLIKTKGYINRYSHLVLPLEKLFKRN